jgi:anti-sigma regulatory factor (Ser/Thr protein kinase)
LPTSPAKRWRQPDAPLRWLVVEARAFDRYPESIERRTTLGRSLAVVRTARRFVRDVLEDNAVSGEVVETIELLTSEVITNALVHARSAPELAVRVRREIVRVEVGDVSPVVPIRLSIDPDALSGRGIAIVDSLASQWGVEDLSAEGKTVWFEVALMASLER